MRSGFLELLRRISVAMGEEFSIVIRNFWRVLTLTSPKSMTGSMSLMMGPLKMPLTWKLIGEPSAI